MMALLLLKIYRYVQVTKITMLVLKSLSRRLEMLDSRRAPRHTKKNSEPGKITGN
jgi:hypothetical protein